MKASTQNIYHSSGIVCGLNRRVNYGYVSNVVYEPIYPTPWLYRRTVVDTLIKKSNEKLENSLVSKYPEGDSICTPNIYSSHQ